MKAQLQQAIANVSPAPTTGSTVPPVPPVVTGAVATLAQRIAAATTLPALLAMEAEARTSAEQGVWLVYLDAVATLHAAATAAAVKAAAVKASDDAAAAKAVVDAALQSNILQVIGKIAPLMSTVPTLLAQVQPALDAYRASRANGQSVTTAINSTALAGTNPPVYETMAQRMAKRSNA